MSEVGRMTGGAVGSGVDGLPVVHEDDSALRVQWDGDSALRVQRGTVPLLRYVYRPTEDQIESPRPYFHPVWTLSGSEVSLYRPHDHVWHKGIAWSLPNVGPANFWGGL